MGSNHLKNILSIFINRSIPYCAPIKVKNEDKSVKVTVIVGFEPTTSGHPIPALSQLSYTSEFGRRSNSHYRLVFFLSKNTEDKSLRSFLTFALPTELPDT